MPTMQSKLVSRTIWLEKKKIWKINIQKNGIRKSFYSSTPGDKGRKICAQNAASWLSGSCPFAVSDHTTVETVFERYLKDKELETTNIYTIRNRYNNHIKPIIGKIPVMLLTKQDLKRVIYTACAEDFFKVSSGPGCFDGFFHFCVLTFVFPIFAHVIPSG